MEEANKPVEVAENVGAFESSLKRNNKQIKDDRAVAIREDAQIVYKRTVEDLEIEIKRLKRTRDNMLDLSPTSAISLMLAEEFDSRKFVETDLNIGVEIRNKEIALNLAKRQYNFLFGKTYGVKEID